MEYWDFPFIYDMHVHLREDPITELIIAEQIEPYVAGVVVQPNLDHPIEEAWGLIHYNAFLRRKLRPKPVTLIGSIKLTRNTTAKTIAMAKKKAGAKTVKNYPDAVTTNSQGGFASVKEINPDIFRAIEDNDMIFAQHPELPGVPPLEAEAAYYQEEAPWLLDHFPNMKMTLEHISTEVGADFVINAPKNVAGTVTAHHPYLYWWWVFEQDEKTIRNPDLYCKPPAGGLKDQDAIVNLAINCPRVFLGTDSAAHPAEAKMLPNPKPGIWVPIRIAVALWLEIFYQYNQMPRFNEFTSSRAADFYGLPKTVETARFVRKEWIVPEKINGLTTFMARKQLQWQSAE